MQGSRNTDHLVLVFPQPRLEIRDLVDITAVQAVSCFLQFTVEFLSARNIVLVKIPREDSEELIDVFMSMADWKEGDLDMFEDLSLDGPVEIGEHGGILVLSPAVV